MLSALGDKKEAALLAVREAADLYRALAAQRPDAFRPDLAMSLSNLAAMLSALGNREAALSAAREAVDIRRALVAQRPDAFRPNFANSLWVLAECLDAVDCRDEGVAANAEAITQLSGLFQRHKRAFAGQIEGMVQGYIRRCEVLGRILISSCSHRFWPASASCRPISPKIAAVVPCHRRQRNSRQ